MIVLITGASRAGKTTTLHTVTGLIRAKEGSIVFKGQDITKALAHKIVTKGLVHVPEGRRIFQSLTVAENLMMGSYYGLTAQKSRRNKQKSGRVCVILLTEHPYTRPDTFLIL